MTTQSHDPIRDALAWFIVEDETNAGGDNEASNEYWLAGRRLAQQFFNSRRDLEEGAQRHRDRMSTRSWPQEMDDIDQTSSAHNEMAVAKRIEEWAAIPD